MKQIACVFQHSSASYRTRCAPFCRHKFPQPCRSSQSHTHSPISFKWLCRKRKSRQARENVNSFTLSSPSSVIETHQFTRCGDNERRLHPRIWWHVLYATVSAEMMMMKTQKRELNEMRCKSNCQHLLSCSHTVYVVRSSFTSLLNSTEHMLQMDIFRKHEHISHVRVCSRRLL